MVNNRPKRAVFYSRVSTTEQVEGTSLDTQKAWCMAQISKMNMAFVKEYSDKGLSGANEQRPGWQRLLADARLEKFDAVFVFDLDRFTRDMLHGLKATRELRALGVTLHDAKDPESDAASADAQLMTGFRLLIAEEERRKIKERTVRGQRAKLEAGQWPGGKPCFGWKLVGIRTRSAEPAPDFDERETLKLIMRWLVLEGKSIGQICELLNVSGIKSRNGGRWGHAVLRRVLSNPALYRGWFVWGSPNGGSVDARSHKTKVDRDGKPIYGTPKKIMLPSPPLSKNEFDAVQRALKAHPRANKHQRPSISRPLTGKLFGDCGKHYTGTSIAGKEYDVYRCTGNRFRGNESQPNRCRCRQINAQKIEERVWYEVSKLMSDANKLQELAKIWLQVDGNDQEHLVAEGDRLALQEQKILKAITMVQDDYYFADEREQDLLKARIAQYRTDLRIITDRQELLQSYQADSKLQVRQLESLAEMARVAKGRIADLNHDEKRQIYDLLRLRVVMSAIVDSQPLTITIHGQIDDRILNAQDLLGSNKPFDPCPELSFVLGN